MVISRSSLQIIHGFFLLPFSPLHITAIPHPHSQSIVSNHFVLARFCFRLRDGGSSWVKIRIRKSAWPISRTVSQANRLWNSRGGGCMSSWYFSMLNTYMYIVVYMLEVVTMSSPNRAPTKVMTRILKNCTSFGLMVTPRLDRMLVPLVTNQYRQGRTPPIVWAHDKTWLRFGPISRAMVPP